MQEWRQLGQLLLAVASAVGLSGCFWFDEKEQTYLTGRYYTETAADTQTRLYLNDKQEAGDEPLLSNVSALGISGKYLAVRDEEKYYLFVREAASREIASKTAIGPLDTFMFRKKLQQLTGDSTLRLSSKF